MARTLPMTVKDANAVLRQQVAPLECQGHPAARPAVRLRRLASTAGIRGGSSAEDDAAQGTCVVLFDDVEMRPALQRTDLRQRAELFEHGEHARG